MRYVTMIFVWRQLSGSREFGFGLISQRENLRYVIGGNSAHALQRRACSRNQGIHPVAKNDSLNVMQHVIVLFQPNRFVNCIERSLMVLLRAQKSCEVPVEVGLI